MSLSRRRQSVQLAPTAPRETLKRRTASDENISSRTNSQNSFTFEVLVSSLAVISHLSAGQEDVVSLAEKSAAALREAKEETSVSPTTKAAVQVAKKRSGKAAP